MAADTMNIEAAFADAMRAHGIEPPSNIVADGELYRFKTTGQGPSKNGWYRLFADGIPAGLFGCWKAFGDEKFKWVGKPDKEMTPAERDALRERMRQAEEKHAAEVAKKHEEARKNVAVAWEAAQPATAEHPYLAGKGVQPHGLRVRGNGALLVPLRDVAGTMHSAQQIDGKGGKYFFAGGRITGCFCAIGQHTGTTVICEGFATGAAIHEATGLPVLCAMNAGNLRAVAEALRAKYPGERIIIALDDDWKLDENVGIVKGQAAAKAVGGIAVAPTFEGERPVGATDFNDMAQLHGQEAVRQAFETALQAPAAPAPAPTPAPAAAARPGPVFPPLEDADKDDGPDRHRNAPRPDPACLYGLVGEVARAGAATTEANPFAIAANFLGYLGVAVGRGPFMAVGNTWHHARLFMMHVGRSGRGRKGDAVSLVTRIDKALRELSEAATPQVHRGGLSSREGLAFLIHDGFQEGKREVEPIHDKRLLVIESEFANILHQAKRDGNTLSPALRDCWDGVSIRPATKSSRLWATHPHVGLLAAITPGELRDLMAQRELTNGFANRFGIFWAERERILPFPRATPQETVDGLARRVLDVLNFCGAERWVERDHLRVELSPEARARYEVLYLGELNDDSAGERITALLERRAPMLLRIAMILALSDTTATVGVQHINAALAWVRYFTDSVKFIFASAVEEEEVAKTSDSAEAIVKFLVERGRATRWELSRDLFKGHISKGELDEAIDLLLTATPPRIVIETEKGKGRPTKFYQLPAKYAKKAKNKHPCGFAADFTSREVCEVSEERGEAPPGVTSQLRFLREDQNRPETRTSVDSSHTSLTSQGDKENAMEADV